MLYTIVSSEVVMRNVMQPRFLQLHHLLCYAEILCLSYARAICEQILELRILHFFLSSLYIPHIAE